MLISELSFTGIVLIGHFYNYGGYAEYAHQIYAAAQLSKIPIKILPNGEIKSAVYKEWSSVVEQSQLVNLGSNPCAIIVDIPPR